MHPVAVRSLPKIPSVRTTQRDESAGLIDVQHLEVLHGYPLSAHSTRHSFPGVDATSASLTLTRAPHTPMRQAHAVARRLSVKSMLLHASCEPLALAVGPRIHELSLAKPRGCELAAQGEQAAGISHSELGQRLLWGHLGRRVVSLHPSAHVLGLPPACPDLHAVIAMLGTGAVRDHLDAVELDERARLSGALTVVDGRHALFDAQDAGARGKGVGFSGERRRRVGRERLVGVEIEP